MPIIRFEGVPENIGKENLVKIKKSVQGATASVPALKLAPTEVTVFFPPDLLPGDQGEEIIITVTGLFIKPERTEEMRNILAKKLALIIKNYFRGAMVECLIMPFDPQQGFATVPHVLLKAT